MPFARARDCSTGKLPCLPCRNRAIEKDPNVSTISGTRNLNVGGDREFAAAGRISLRVVAPCRAIEIGSDEPRRIIGQYRVDPKSPTTR